MKFHFIGIAFVVALLFPLAARALEVDCGEEKTGAVTWKYCLAVTPGSRNADVLYHLHGRTLGERAWADDGYYTGMLRRAWRGRNIDAPTVVSVSFGPDWLLVAKNGSPYSGLLELFTRVVVPTLEQRLGGIEGKRLVLGESMGGFNATALALKVPGLFERAALLCPPMTTLSPFAAEEEIVSFLRRTGAQEAKVRDAIRMSRAFLPTTADWLGADPLTLAAKASPATTPRLYVSCGYYDEYGFFEGAERFAALTQGNGVPTTWRPVWGGHCATDIDSLAAFLAP